MIVNIFRQLWTFSKIEILGLKSRIIKALQNCQSSLELSKIVKIWQMLIVARFIWSKYELHIRYDFHIQENMRKNMRFKKNMTKNNVLNIFPLTLTTQYDICPFSSYWTSYLSSYFWNMAKNMRYQFNENSSYFCHIWTRWNALVL